MATATTTREVSSESRLRLNVLESTPNSRPKQTFQSVVKLSPESEKQLLEAAGHQNYRSKQNSQGQFYINGRNGRHVPVGEIEVLLVKRKGKFNIELAVTPAEQGAERAATTKVSPRSSSSFAYNDVEQFPMDDVDCHGSSMDAPETGWITPGTTPSRPQVVYSAVSPSLPMAAAAKATPRSRVTTASPATSSLSQSSSTGSSPVSHEIGEISFDHLGRYGAIGEPDETWLVREVESELRALEADQFGSNAITLYPPPASALPPPREPVDKERLLKSMEALKQMYASAFEMATAARKLAAQLENELAFFRTLIENGTHRLQSCV